MARSLVFGGLSAIGLLLVAVPVHALVSSASSSTALLETVPPNPGTAMPPATASPGLAASIPYSGAGDAHTGLASVQLYVRFEANPWVTAGAPSATPAGSFSYMPPNAGTAFFDLVARDNVGNTSAVPSGVVGNGDGSTFFDSLLAVDLVSFAAAQTGASVTVSWATAAELDNAGFFVHRAQDGGAAERLSSLIPAEGSAGAGASYSFVDAAPIAAGESTRSYVLIDVDLAGAQTVHGPVSAALTTGAPSAVPAWTLY